MDIAVLLVIILIVVVIWRGPSTLPQIGAMLGRGVREVRREVGAKKDEPGDQDGPA